MNESIIVGILTVRGTMRAAGSSSVPLLWHTLVAAAVSGGAVVRIRRDNEPGLTHAATAHHLEEIPA